TSVLLFFFPSRRRHTGFPRDWSSAVCSSDPGVSIQDVSPDIADSLGLPRARGALVTQPSEDGPAAAAGVQSGDVILTVDGEQIEIGRASCRERGETSGVGGR